MGFKTLAVALALTSAVTAAPALNRRDDCQDAYKACVAAGTPEVACACTLTACLGEDNARNREYCASATASLASSTSLASPTTLTSSTSIASPTSTWSIPGGCNPAHPGSCPTSTWSIPGGCNPAHPGSCPTPTSLVSKVTPTPSAKPDSGSGSGSGSGSSSGYSDPKAVEGKSWTIGDLIRYCGEDNSGCDYNFVIKSGDKTERCTVIRMPGSDAATESWSDQPCTSGSNFKVSWGYVTEPGPAYAVITVVNGKELAWFGVSDVNGNEVTPNSPFGSGSFGNLGPQQVYTY